MTVEDQYPVIGGTCPNCYLPFSVRFINKFHCINCGYPIIVFKEYGTYLESTVHD